MLYDDDVQLFRSSFGYTHFYSGTAISNMTTTRMLKDIFFCAGCEAEDVKPKSSKKKGSFTLSLLKGYVENEVLSVQVAASIVLRMMKTYKVAELQLQFPLHHS